MTPDQAAKLLPIIKAYSEGKTIELYFSSKWQVIKNLDFSFPENNYRIKPEKKKGWINIYRNGTELNYSNRIHETKEKALLNKSNIGYTDTIQIEWEDNAN